jgi:chitodextrinase
MADPTTWTNIGSPVSGTSVPVSGLTPGASYDLRVIATGPGGSATSSVLTVTTGTYVLPGAPGAPVIGVITSNSVALTWGLSTTGTVPINYQAQYRLAGQTTWSLFGSPAANASSVTITGLTASSNYEFSVVASNPAGTTVSGVTAAKTASASAAPSAPSGLNVQSASANSLTIGWSASSGTPPITYQPQYRPSGSGTWINVGSATSETSVQVTNLSPGTSYDFQVIASGPGGSATSSVLTVSTPAATTPPSAPVNFAITAIMTTGASLSWETPASGTRPINYQPQYRLSGTTVWSSFGSLIPSLTVTITGLLSGRTYDFQVVATNSGGSTPSAILTAATIVPPSFPSSPGPLTPWIITPTSVSLSWPGSKGSATPVLYQPQYRDRRQLRLVLFRQ